MDRALQTAAYDDMWDPTARTINGRVGAWRDGAKNEEVAGAIEARLGYRPTSRSIRHAAQERRERPERFLERVRLRGVVPPAPAQGASGAEESCPTLPSARYPSPPPAPEPEPPTIPPPPRPPSNLQRWLIVPDTHAPYHDRESWATMIAAARTLDLHGIVVQGDLLDLYSVSSHDREPHRVSKLAVEILDCLDCLDDLDSLGAAEKVYCFGNHENRLRRYLVRKAPELFGTVDVETLLRLEDRGWKWHKYRKSVKVGDLVIVHDVGQHGKYAALNAAARLWQPAAIGHVHRSQLQTFICPRTGHPVPSASFGWLGSYDLAGEYKSEDVARIEWPHGFGLAYVEPSGAVHLRPIVIANGRCIVEGRLIERPGSKRWAA